MSEFSRTQGPDRRVDHSLKTTPEGSVFVSVLTLAEIRRCIELLSQGRRRSELEQWLQECEASLGARFLSITKPIAERWAVLAARNQRSGVTLAVIDGLIAPLR